MYSFLFLSLFSDRKFPKVKHLYLFKLIGTLFPRKDRHHSLITPSLYCICFSLSLCSISSSKDLSIGLFLCGLVFFFVSPTKRLASEPLIFLERILTLVAIYLCSVKGIENRRKERERESERMRNETEIPCGFLSNNMKTFLGKGLEQERKVEKEQETHEGRESDCAQEERNEHEKNTEQEAAKEFLKITILLIRKFSVLYSHFDSYSVLFGGFFLFFFSIVFFSERTYLHYRN